METQTLIPIDKLIPSPLDPRKAIEVEVKLPDGRQAMAVKLCLHGQSQPSPAQPKGRDAKMLAANDWEDG